MTPAWWYQLKFSSVTWSSRAVRGVGVVLASSSKKMAKGSAAAAGVAKRGWRLGIVNAVADGVRCRKVEVRDRARNAVERDGIREPMMVYR